MVMEEVSLDGDLQPIEGILLLSISARKESLNSIGELLSFFNNSRLSMAQNKEVFTTTTVIRKVLIILLMSRANRI